MKVPGIWAKVWCPEYLIVVLILALVAFASEVYATRLDVLAYKDFPALQGDPRPSAIGSEPKEQLARPE